MSKRSIVHVELPAADRAVTGQFYSELFGWETQDMPEFHYMTFVTGSVGGGFSSMDARPNGAVVYIESEDIEADLKAIEAKGGKVLEPKMEVPGTGWLAHFADPTGNRVGLWTPKDE